MKILAFVDIHGNKSALKRLVELSKDSNVLVCAGDISNWGKDLDELISILEKANKPLLIVPGNHETAEQIRLLSKKFKFVIPIHKGSYQLNEYVFFGYGEGGFSQEEPSLARIIPKFKETIKKDQIVILVTHAPPYGTKLDFLMPNHSGCKTITEFIKDIHPKLVICGHLHENFGKKDIINKTLMINPGPSGKIINL